jgi:hypothetical protein
LNPGRAFVAGLVGTLVMSLIMLLLRAAGVPLHVEVSLAAAAGSSLWFVGLAIYLLIGGLLGIGYALVFEYALHDAGVGPGLLLGAINTIFAGFFWSLVTGPGHFWDHLGAEGIAALFLVHFAFGAVVGGLYRTEHTLVYQ